MKVLVYYAPGAKYDVFEGTRLRKNIKGGLELSGVNWVESIFALPDIAHFISPLDEAKAHDCREEGIKIAVSAFYCEADETCRYFEKDEEGVYMLSPKAERLIKEADLVFVPTVASRDLLFDCGFGGKDIRIVSPGVNVTRFEARGDMERAMFHRYMRFRDEEKYCLALGDQDDKETVAQLIRLAELTPSVRFFFLGGRQEDSRSGRLNRKAPKNLVFSSLIEDDLYCAGLVGAEAFLVFSSAVNDEMPILEAMAAKTQVINIGPIHKNRLLEEGKNCLSYNTVEEASSGLIAIIGNDDAGTEKEARKIALANSLKVVGKQLKEGYESLLKEEEK